MDAEEFEYGADDWLVREDADGDWDWPYWHVAARLYDVDDRSRHYRLSWQHPVTGEYREQTVPSSAAVEEFERVPEGTVVAEGRAFRPTDSDG